MALSWNQIGTNLMYTCCDQSSDGIIILLASGTSIYCSIDNGLTWGSTDMGINENIISVSISADGTIAYCCSSSTIYVCTDFSVNSLNWGSVTVFNGIEVTWNSIVVSNKLNTNNIHLVYAGSTTGLYGITSGTDAILLDNNNTSKNWIFINVMKIATNDVVIGGIVVDISGNRNIYMNTDGNSNNSFIKLSTFYIPSPNSISIFQNLSGPLIFYIYATSYILDDTLYLSTNAGTFVSIPNTRAGNDVFWRYISVGYKQYTTFVVCKSFGQIYTSNNGGISLNARETNRDWLQVVNSTTTNNNLIAITSSSNRIFNSSNGGVSCIIYNTKILLGNGEEDFVQNLKKGDMIKTSEGNKRIIFIGYNFMTNKNHVRLLKKDMISINIPNQDLLLSKGHAILLNDDDFVKYRVGNYNKNFYNSTTKIDGLNKLMMCDCVLCEKIPLLYLEQRRYFHIVLENNKDVNKQYIIYTNGMPSESMSEYCIFISNLRPVQINTKI